MSLFVVFVWASFRFSVAVPREAGAASTPQHIVNPLNLMVEGVTVLLQQVMVLLGYAVRSARRTRWSGGVWSAFAISAMSPTVKGRSPRTRTSR